METLRITAYWIGIAWPIYYRKQGSTHCYRNVYPSLERREDTFDKFLESKTVVANYQGVHQMWMIDIEHMLSEETVLRKRTASTETKSTKRRSVAKRTDSSGTKSADSSTSCIGNKSSCINATPPVLEGTSVQHTPAAAIPFLPEFTGTLDNSSLDCSGERQSEEYGVVPTVENYHQLTDSPIFPQHDCLVKADVSQDIEVTTHGQFTGANSNDFDMNGTAEDQNTYFNLEISEQHLTLLNILEEELA
ncbi:hypothetical protein DPMN_088438 [Dreissena polymorpha]|uniref:Uncharacterized protein n=1 Tax=Dreissena polymorpha TaxID=45954 RepID=A0A9D4KUI9_DREPO|nr:hypothetical protein DPMN_088438 [Dreissena polymorpha]